jgi:membrane protease YdiL (CAAX protease family)
MFLALLGWGKEDRLSLKELDVTRIISSLVYLLTLIVFTVLYFRFIIVLIPNEIVADLANEETIEYSKISMVVYFVSMILFTPVLEEIAFRHYLLKFFLQKKVNTIFTVTSLSLCFALLHMIPDILNRGINIWIYFIPYYFTVSIVLYIVRLRHKNIMSTILIHVLLNTFIYGIILIL